jgi:glycosyltransferase involved in cell wall biosynthesis
MVMSLNKLRNKKILYITNDLYFFENHFARVAQAIIAIGFDVFVAADRLDAEVENKFLEFKFLRVPIDRSGINPLKELNTIRKIHSLMLDVKPGIIHNITIKPILYGSLATRFIRRPIQIVNSVTGLGYAFTGENSPFLKRAIQRMLTLFIPKKRAHFIFLNKVDFEVYQNLGLITSSNHTFIRGSGVDSSDFIEVDPPQKGKIIIVCTARMLKDKGIIELKKTSEEMYELYHEKIKFHLYGGIDLKNPAAISEQELLDMKVDDYFEWKGFTNKIKQALENCHIYCLPSYREGLPKAIVEAMAIGRPILTTNAPGCDDCVIEGKNGFKVPIKDSIGLQEKLILLVQDESLREKMGKESRKYFEKEFTLEQVVQQHMQLYSNLRIFE